MNLDETIHTILHRSNDIGVAVDLFESDARTQSLARKARTTGGYAAWVAYNRALAARRLPQEWPDNILEIVENDAAQALRSRTRSPRNFTMGTYKGHIVEIVPNTTDIIYHQSMALRLLFGAPASPRRPGRGELHGSNGGVHCRLGRSLWVPQIGNTAVENIAQAPPLIWMAAEYGWENHPLLPIGEPSTGSGVSITCYSYEPISKWGTVVDILDEMISCGNKNMAGLQRRYSARHQHYNI